MTEREESRMVVLYDGECGFCKVMLAVLLTWDRAHRLVPVPIQGAGGERLLPDMPAQARLKSWHLIDGVGLLHSGGMAIPIILAALPLGTPLARITSRFPRMTSLAYEWVASHRTPLGRPLGTRSRAWAARVIAGARSEPSTLGPTSSS